MLQTALEHVRRCRFFLVAGTVGIVLCFAAGCASTPAEPTLSINFTSIPAANPGGPLTTGSIAGRVNGPHDGLKLVLYAKSRRWYVQPYADQPFTAIKPDSSWGSPTHLGTDYAALLVQPEYVPPPVMDVIPNAGGPVLAVAVTEGTPPVWRRWWFRLLLIW